MLPIILNMSALRIGLAGTGEGFARRRTLLAKAGPETPTLFEGRAPDAAELGNLDIIFVAGLGETESRGIAEAARAAHVLVNVEDMPELCDFHVPAQVRRGDLLFTVSTSGRSPSLSSALRADIERRFGPEWDARLTEIAQLRDRLRAGGAKPAEVSERTAALLSQKGWLG